MAWEVKCRDEDMKQRALENERRAIDDARRSVDEKAQQLKTLSHQSALIAGFSMVVLVEVQISQNLHPVLLVSFGCTTAGVVGLMLIAMLNATYMLVAILRYDTVHRDMPFAEFWRKRCEGDWKLSLRAFGIGVPLFMLDLAQVGWVVFWEHKTGIIASSIVTVIAIFTVLIYLARIDRKWSGWLMSSKAKLHTIEN
eukprot:CAMPEP_0184860848 /NCGR_PEP_ID=MMETSP0580-20130426/5652_1 /TAXON_ID=1118495 /ORGANISM="Dactyliosolen fragilissimus" /LENGTH=196 /DNA_ID=CAMNT_0027358103 /DNA_START=254 /DNA_END=844 /DNA_ORIENTATION=+